VKRFQVKKRGPLGERRNQNRRKGLGGKVGKKKKPEISGEKTGARPK